MSREKISNEIQELLKNEIITRHSYFQLKFLLIGKEHTHQSRMWRCLTELKSRKEAMDGIELEIAEVKDQLRLLEIQKIRLSQQTFNDRLEKEEIEIKIRQLDRQIKANESNLTALAIRDKHNTEEADFFIRSFHSLRAKEPLRPYDDLEAQQEYWDKKIEQEINLKAALGHPLDSELIKTALCLGNESSIKKKVIDMLSMVAEPDRKRTEEDCLLQRTRMNE